MSDFAGDLLGRFRTVGDVEVTSYDGLSFTFAFHVGGKTFTFDGEVGSRREPEFDNAVPVWIATPSEEFRLTVFNALKATCRRTVREDEALDAILSTLNAHWRGGPQVTSVLQRLLSGHATLSDLVAATQQGESPFMCVLRE